MTIQNIDGKSKIKDTWHILPENDQDLQDQIDTHLADTNNPHDVTASQVGAETPAGAQAKTDAVQTNLTNHIGTGGTAHANATQTTAGFESAEDKTKLDGIQAGAEVNQNSFSIVSVSGQSDVLAETKTDTLTLKGGTGISITTNPTTDEVTFTATSEAVPGAHASSHITGGADVIPNAVSGGNAGLMSGPDKTNSDSTSKVTAKSANATLITTEAGTINVTTGASDKTITLPDATTAQVVFTIKKVDNGAGHVVINTTNFQLIDGSSSKTLTNQYSTISVVSDGSNWIIKTDNFTDKIGILSGLLTVDKSSTVNAINENKTNIGTLTSLTTTDKTSVVNSLNETRARVTPVANGGTGSATQNFVDLSTAQTIAGNKSFTGTVTLNGNNALQALSGGYKLQSGTTTVTIATAGAGLSASVTFPVVFGTAPLVFVVLNGAPNTSGYIVLASSSITTTGFSLFGNSYVAQQLQCSWFAIGA